MDWLAEVPFLHRPWCGLGRPPATSVLHRHLAPTVRWHLQRRLPPVGPGGLARHRAGAGAPRGGRKRGACV